MSGSINWVTYVTDDGIEYAIKHDLSNLEVTGQSTDPPDQGVQSLPTGITPRYVLYRTPDNVRQRKIVILDVEGDTPLTLPPTISLLVFQGADTIQQTFYKSFYRGESQRFPIIGVDTGVNELGGV